MASHFTSNSKPCFPSGSASFSETERFHQLPALQGFRQVRELLDVGNMKGVGRIYQQTFIANSSRATLSFHSIGHRKPARRFAPGGFLFGAAI